MDRNGRQSSAVSCACAALTISLHVRASPPKTAAACDAPLPHAAPKALETESLFDAAIVPGVRH